MRGHVGGQFGRLQKVLDNSAKMETDIREGGVSPRGMPTATSVASRPEGQAPDGRLRFQHKEIKDDFSRKRRVV